MTDTHAYDSRPHAVRAHRIPDKARPPILFVPGLYNSDDDHWQSHWLDSLPDAERVTQADWAEPRLADWSANLRQAIERSPGAVLVAHSLGCALVAHVAATRAGRCVKAALLVAPADVDRNDAPCSLPHTFAPMPRSPLPFPSTVVASRDDPFVSFERAKRFAAAWRSRFVDLGCAGHVNVASGHGPWPEGRRFLRALTQVRTIGREQRGEPSWT